MGRGGDRNTEGKRSGDSLKNKIAKNRGSMLGGVFKVRSAK